MTDCGRDRAATIGEYAMVGDTVSALCTRCAAEPRVRGQRWGRRCLTAHQRERRAARRALRQAPDPSAGVVAVEPSPVTQPAPDDASALGLDARDALARYRQAVTELDRVTRETNWRRSRYSPSMVVGPLHEAVTRLASECRRLGIPTAP